MVEKQATRMCFPETGGSGDGEIESSIKYPKIHLFVKKNGHFPFTGGTNEEETELGRFWAKQQHRFRNGSLSAHCRDYYGFIIEKYGHLQEDRKDYEWKQCLARLKKAYKSGDITLIGEKEQKWLAKQFSKYATNSLTRWQQTEMAKLIKTISSFLSIHS